ncbi:hypothetical protein E2C01_034878 [Portunus trituberculatus]|uniref:Uncharacterized protein n=1 Tax=Portunus trituberculatus TaxID=210409 RepID=A0A5B7F7S9_PORTR|nr:hypothetical protein [Portunus trituberculatus]
MELRLKGVRVWLVMEDGGGESRRRNLQGETLSALSGPPWLYRRLASLAASHPSSSSGSPSNDRTRVTVMEGNNSPFSSLTSGSVEAAAVSVLPAASRILSSSAGFRLHGRSDPLSSPPD